MGSCHFTCGRFPLFYEVVKFFLFCCCEVDNIFICHVSLLVRRAAYPMEEHLSKFLWSSTSVILGVLLGVLLGYGVVQEWQLRVRRKRDIDRLIEQFQALFRQINQEKQQRP